MHYLTQRIFENTSRHVIIAALFLLALNFPVQSASQQGAKDIVATQLRAQGIPCTKPVKATQDAQDSSPDEIAWILSCKEATYRVKLIPHVGSKVEIIDDGQSEAVSVGSKE